MHQSLGEVSVAGQQEEALAVIVEAADGIHVAHAPVQQVEHRGTSLGIVTRRHIATRLVQQDVPGRGAESDAATVDPDVVGHGRPCSQRAHHSAVDGDTPVDNQLFRGASGRHASRR
jgi:hypothetical protein